MHILLHTITFIRNRSEVIRPLQTAPYPYLDTPVEPTQHTINRVCASEYVLGILKAAFLSKTGSVTQLGKGRSDGGTASVSEACANANSSHEQLSVWPIEFARQDRAGQGQTRSRVLNFTDTEKGPVSRAMPKRDSSVMEDEATRDLASGFIYRPANYRA